MYEFEMAEVMFSPEQKENFFKAAKRYYQEIVWINEIDQCVQDYIYCGGQVQDFPGYDTDQEVDYFDANFDGLANMGATVTFIREDN